MRKTLLLLVLLFSLNQAFAFITQGNYRWRNDDGNEATATWKADVSSPITITSKAENLRLRFNLIGANNGEIPATAMPALYYQRIVNGTPDPAVQVTSSENADFMTVASAHVTHGTATTPQMTEPGTFVAGQILTSEVSPNITLPVDFRTEFEWVLKPGSTIQANMNYRFYVGTSPFGDPVYALLTTSGILPLKLLSFDAKPAQNKVQLHWITAEEVNVSRFEIERSADGNKFSPIGSLPVSIGDGAKSYTYIDMAPLAAGNHYRLKIVDADGSFTYSQVNRVKMGEGKTSLSVYPNPAKDQLNIRFTAPEGPVQVYLQDVSGRTLKVFAFHSDGQEINTIAETSTLQRGIYFIRFNNETISFLKD